MKAALGYPGGFLRLGLAELFQAFEIGPVPRRYYILNSLHDGGTNAKSH
jgi:hypothetical protein